MIYAHKDTHGFDIYFIEEKYNVKYVGEFCYPNTLGGWANFPVAIFHGEKHPQGSEYMAVLVKPMTDQVVVMDGLSCVKQPFIGIYNPETDEFTYSAYRHDFQTLESNKGKISIDGGRDYLKTVGNLDDSNIQKIHLKVLDEKIMLDITPEKE